MSAGFQFPNFGANPAAQTMGDVYRGLQERLERLVNEQKSHFLAAEALNPEIREVSDHLRVVEKLMGVKAEHATPPAFPPSHGSTALTPAASLVDTTVAQRPGPAVRPAQSILRKIALDLGAKHPEGFRADDVVKAFHNDPNIDAETKNVAKDYVYRCIKGMRAEGLLDKEKHLFFLRTPEMVSGDDADGPPPTFQGYKLVPLTKKDRIRIETKNYLKKRGGKAHRAQIAEHLINIGVMGSEENPIGNMSIYLGKWPEFQSIGDGTYALAEKPEETK